MSSTNPDLTPQARIRTAAVDLFGRQGFAATTVRQIAAAAGVSAGLVIHHFGSKDGLRSACDDWVIDEVLAEQGLLRQSFDVAQMSTYAAEHHSIEPMARYIVAALREGGPMAQRIFDRLCDASETVMDEGERTGVLQLPDDRTAAVALLAAWSCGVMMLGPQFAARLGHHELLEPAVVERYARVAAELLTHGVFAPGFLTDSPTPTQEN